MQETELIRDLSQELAVVLENYVPHEAWDAEAIAALSRSHKYLKAKRKPIPDSVAQVLGTKLNRKLY